MHRRMVEIGAAAFMALIVALGAAGFIVALGVGAPLLAQQEDGAPVGHVSMTSVDGEVFEGVIIDGVVVDRYTGEVVEGAPVPGPSVTPPGDGVPRPGGPGRSMAGPSVMAPGNSVPRPSGPSLTAGPADPTRSRQMLLAQMKQRLGIDDQAWKVVEPRLAKVMDLNRQLSTGGGLFGTFGGGPGGSVVVRRAGPGTSAAPANATAQVRTVKANPPVRAGGPQGEPTALDKATAQLRTMLENPSVSLEDIKTQLTALRQARERVKQELAAAQQDLKQVLTVRQEVQLVLMGQLS